MAFLKFNKAELVNLAYSLKREIILDADEVKALKEGDTLTIGQDTVKIESLRQDEEGDILINDEYDLRITDNEVRVFFYEREFMETIDTISVPVEDDLVFVDGIDPESGAMLDQPTEHTAAEFISMLSEPAGITFDSENIWVTFDEDGKLVRVERFYTPWQ